MKKELMDLKNLNKHLNNICMYKIFAISILFSVFNTYCFSQTTIRYDYDMAGNMVVRSVITLKSGVFEKQTTEKQPINEAELDILEKTEYQNEEVFVGENKVIVYPNPTKGKLKIEVQNISDYSIVEVVVYSSSGKIIHKSYFSDFYEIVDLSANPRGVYFMQITIGNKKREWKIILE
ncbi:MAG: T9SS type A sorting domain-containing protein [Bacteroidales bacterium]|nr:T9SS type A sorting domain-containing protein [Bacteroidales bacterium]